MQAKFVETSHQKSLHEHEPKLSGKLGRWQVESKVFSSALVYAVDDGYVVHLNFKSY
ncbi:MULTISPECIES: hypothetical protein [Fischerella]|uniref:hypothetical protein n=1 Tax=Fischerella TaxID=1190 RepID=UPI0002E4BEC5|nr:MULTISPECIES: hypothetical protein [Fischerella]